MAKRKSKKNQQIKFSPKDLSQIIAVGVKELEKRHPRLRGTVDYLKSDIDRIEVGHAVQQLYEQNKDKGIPTSRLKEIIMTYLSEGIAKGGYFNKRGQKLILEKAREYGKLASMLHPVVAIKRKMNPDYLDRAMDAFSIIYDVMEKGGYSGVVPQEIREKVGEMKEIGFYDTMLEILHQKKVLPGRTVLYGRGKIREKAKRATKETIYGMKQRIATAVFLIAGTFLLAFSSANITGFAIAGREVPVSYSITSGFILLLVGLCLSFLRRKPKQAKIKKKAVKKKGKKK